MTADPQLADYYARRASEYDRIYAKPERQADLQKLREYVEQFASERRVLEIACGTGYWTEVIAASAVSVTALDINLEVLEIARHRLATSPRLAAPRDSQRVRLLCQDLYTMSPQGDSPDAGFAGFWWSHVSRGQLAEFLAAFHRHLAPGASVMFIDNRFVAGSSTPISRTDAEGNTYQIRRLNDGTASEVLKNFPTPAELEAPLSSVASNLQIQCLEYYWCLTYRIALDPSRGAAHTTAESSEGGAS